MNQQPQLTESEWAVIVELLEQELHSLAPEIHHTSVSRVRDDLRYRKEVVQHLLERLRPVGV